MLSPSSYPTQKGWMPDPIFRLRIAGIHRGIHASDSHIYNRRGIMDRGAFDDIFKCVPSVNFEKSANMSGTG